MPDTAIEGGLFVIIVFMLIMAATGNAPKDSGICSVRGNPGSYVCVPE